MKRLIKSLAITAAMAAGKRVWRQYRRKRGAKSTGPGADDRDRWLAVTVNAPPERVEAEPRLRRVLARPGLRLQMRIDPAPGDRGTELAVRLKEQPLPHDVNIGARLSGRDPRQPVRRALRDAKSLVETGEILELEPRTSGPRTLASGLVEAVSRRAAGEGRL